VGKIDNHSLAGAQWHGTQTAKSAAPKDKHLDKERLMKKIALFMAAAGFLAFSGLARAQEGAAPAGEKTEKKTTKKGKKDTAAPAGETAPAKTEKKTETK
jgi:hypothetical protein